MEQEFAARKAAKDAKEAADADFVLASQQGDVAASTPTAGTPAAATPTANGADPMIVEDNSQENIDGVGMEHKGKGKGENSKGENSSARHSPM